MIALAGQLDREKFATAASNSIFFIICSGWKWLMLTSQPRSLLNKVVGMKCLASASGSIPRLTDMLCTAQLEGST